MEHWNWQQWETLIVGGSWLVGAGLYLAAHWRRHSGPPMSRHRDALDHLARIHEENR